MNEEQKKSPSERTLRPALIVSENVVSEYTIFLEHLLVGLSNESIPVAMVSPRNCDMDSVVTGAVEVVRHPVFNLPLMGRLNRNELIEQLSRFKPTVLHCLCESKARLTKQLARQLDLPYVITVNSLHRRWRHFRYQRRMHTLSVLSSHCATIIVPAQSIAENIVQVYPKYAERIKQIDIGTFAGESSVCFSEPSRLPSMVIAHPLDNVDKLENLFGAVRHLTIEGYEFMLVVIGGGRAERQLRRLLAALGLLQTVTIIPRLRPWRSVVGAGDIFIQPVASTSFNPLLLEAMSIGSVVAACKGGVDDLIIEDQTAVVFDPSDENNIMCCLQRLLDRRELARQIAEGAQQYLREHHTVSNMISSVLQTYRQAEQWYRR